ncbi:MAG: transglutaminase-like domain-containing protein [Candidatus Methylomirabilia bacterium]
MPLSGWRAALFLASWLAGTSVAGASTFEVGARQGAYQVVKRVVYRYLVANDTGVPAKDARVWISAPVRQTAYQKCLRIESSQPCELEVDRMGNQLLLCTFDRLPPYGRKLITVSAELAMAGTPVPAVEALEDLAAYVVPERYIESDHPEIRKAAAMVRGGGPRETVAKAYHWVRDAIRYGGYRSGRLGALETLRLREGDCTEYMDLLIALCRVNGVPARGVAGYVIDGDTFLKPAAYHNWAEVYVDGAWLIADPQGGELFPDRAGYVAMAHLGGAGTVAAGAEANGALGDGLAIKME